MLKKQTGAFYAVVQVHYAVVVEYMRGVSCEVERTYLLEIRGTDAASVGRNNCLFIQANAH